MPFYMFLRLAFFLLSSHIWTMHESGGLCPGNPLQLSMYINTLFHVPKHVVWQFYLLLMYTWVCKGSKWYNRVTLRARGIICCSDQVNLWYSVENVGEPLFEVISSLSGVNSPSWMRWYALALSALNDRRWPAFDAEEAICISTLLATSSIVEPHCRFYKSSA